MGINLLFDVLLCLFLAGLAWRILTVRQLYQATIFFIAFGLTMALAWVRLDAPDVALAEAAIGAGLLGVLLIDSLRVLAPGSPAEVSGDDRTTDAPVAPRASGKAAWSRLTTALLLGTGMAMAFLIAVAILFMPEGGGLATAAAGAMAHSGVEHPVTAVLLNFRSFDTWLEVGVLLLAMMGLFVVHGVETPPGKAAATRSDPLLDWLTRALVPVLILAAGYLLWLGKFAPGGAFQSGVVLGAGAVLLRLNGFALIERLPLWIWRGSLILGFAGFLIHGTGSLFFGRAFLEFPVDQAGTWILGLEALAAFSIAVTLAAFFIVLHGADREDEGPPQNPEGGN